MDRDNAFLIDLLTEARSILNFIAGMSFEQFLRDSRTRKAVERSFEILGEASRSLSKEFRDAHPELPWRWMVDTRNVITHRYRQVNYAVLWETIRYDLPDLIRLLEPLVPPEDTT